MAETREPKMNWYSPMALADRANDGFLSIARSAGKAARLIHSGTIGSISKIQRALSRKKKMKKSRQPTHPVNIKESTPTDETTEESLKINFDGIKESAPMDETPEERGSSPTGVTTESDID